MQIAGTSSPTTTSPANVIQTTQGRTVTVATTATTPTPSPQATPATATATQSNSVPVTVAPPAAVPALTGQLAFYSNRDGNDEIYLMDAGGSHQTRLTTHPASDLFPHLSPDGHRIAFMSDRDGNWEIYIIHVDGSHQTRLTNHPANDRLPTWSPDSRQLAFSSDRDGITNIYVIDADGRNLTQLTFGPDRKGHPTWSPDGRWLAFNAGPTESEWELYTIPASGGDMRRLTNNLVIDWAPSWSPIGDSILFLSKRPENADIYLIRADGSDERQIFSGPGYEWGVVWSPDGQYLAFTSDQSGRDEIYTMRLDGTDLHRLTDAGGAYPSWSIKPSSAEPVTIVQPTSNPPPTATPLGIVAPTSLPSGACQKPVEDYTRVVVNGELINRRTELMLETAIALYGGPGDLKRVTQGSYTNELDASFETHAGGGVVDISIRNPAKPAERLFGEVEAMVGALRLAGFAAWYREADLLYPGMAPHIHAVAIGDKELSLAAQEQLTGPHGYFRSFDGLPDDSPTPDPHGGPIICDWMLEAGYADLR